MAMMLENLRLDDLLESEETFEGFVGYCINNGKPLPGYSGGVYFMHHLRDAQICVRVFVDEENGKLLYAGIDTHEDSWTHWELRVFADITPKGSDILFRRILFKNNANGEGILPVDIVNADVLESFLPDDVIKLQMIGFPVQINYFATEDEYMESCDEFRGKKLGLDDGTIMASGFMNNHNPDNELHDDDADSYVVLRGTVKSLYFGYINEDTEEQEAGPSFIRCIVGTKYGDLEICHTIFQVDEAQRKNIEIGATVSGIFILSGDAAIDDRINGAVFNEGSDLKVFRQAMEKGDTLRLKTVLADKAAYYSEGDQKTYTGFEEIKDKIDAVNQCWGEKIKTYMATLTGKNGEEELKYQAGKRCVVVSYDEGNTYERILFLDINEEGKVESLTFSNDSRYTFKIDEAPGYDDDEEEENINELLAELSTEEGRKRIKNRMLLSHLQTLCDGYTTGDFEPLFFMLADDVVLESQWVLTPCKGRKAVEEYFSGKGETLKKHNAFPKCWIVRLAGNANPVEGNISVNGNEPEHATIALQYPEGKLCMYMSQTLEDKTNGVIVDLTLDERNSISRIDLCMPELFDFELYEDNQNGQE